MLRTPAASGAQAVSALRLARPVLEVEESLGVGVSALTLVEEVALATVSKPGVAGQGGDPLRRPGGGSGGEPRRDPTGRLRRAGARRAGPAAGRGGRPGRAHRRRGAGAAGAGGRRARAAAARD